MDVDKHSQIWRELIHYNNEIFHYIRKYIGESEIAKDICQDVYYQAIRNIDKLKLEKNIRAWLYRVARNTSINYLKSQKIRNHDDIDETYDVSDTAMSTDFNDVSPFIEAAFSNLPERQRIALQLREIDGYSYDELAKTMGLSESAVTSLLSRARENFQKNYLLNLLPDTIGKLAKNVTNIQDIFRYIDPENPPLDLSSELDQITTSYFKRVNQGWDKIRDTFFSAQDLKGIFERIDFNYDESLLDLGTGTGFIALHFAPYVKEVIGLDSNSEMLHSAVMKKKSLGLNNVSFIQGNIEKLPFYGRTFDVIVCNLVLHHLVDPFSSLKEIKKVLKKDGKLIIVDFNRHSNKSMADEMKDLWLGFKPDEIKKWMKELYFTSFEHFTLKPKRKKEGIPEIFCLIATY